MKLYRKYINEACCALLTLTVLACGNTETKTSSPARVKRISQDEEVVYNDALWLNKFVTKASTYYKENGGIDDDTYKSQMASKICMVSTKDAANLELNGNVFYTEFKKSILVVGTMYKCGHCPDDHLGTASAFLISDDGVCVSNYHVFKSYDPAQPNDYITAFVMDADQNVYPVTEVLAASKQDDLAIFKIDTNGHSLSALPLGDDLPTGEPVHVISHPDKRFYTYTQGHVNRSYIKPGTTKIRQCISAEFAKGSSGAAVMDKCGNVIGIVAGTQNIYYVPQWEAYQATIKEIIPVSRLKELIK